MSQQNFSSLFEHSEDGNNSAAAISDEYSSGILITSEGDCNLPTPTKCVKVEKTSFL